MKNYLGCFNVSGGITRIVDKSGGGKKNDFSLGKLKN